jgi:hypothetical protein
LGGANGVPTTLTTMLAVPTAQLQLSFWIFVDTAETAGAATPDTAAVVSTSLTRLTDTTGTVTPVFSANSTFLAANGRYQSGWQLVTFTFPQSGYHLLTFSVTNGVDSSLPTAIMVDDVRVRRHHITEPHCNGDGDGDVDGNGVHHAVVNFDDDVVADADAHVHQHGDAHDNRDSHRDVDAHVHQHGDQDRNRVDYAFCVDDLLLSAGVVQLARAAAPVRLDGFARIAGVRHGQRQRAVPRPATRGAAQCARRGVPVGRRERRAHDADDHAGGADRRSCSCRSGYSSTPPRRQARRRPTPPPSCPRASRG